MRAPLVPAHVDLRSFRWVPVDRVRLFASAFNAQANDSEWRVGFTLWLKSWDQVPAGSLPNDDVELCRMVELGRDLKTWRRLKRMALHGWTLCDDGRLYHGVVAEFVTQAWKRREAQRNRTQNARDARLLQKKNSADDRLLQTDLSSFSGSNGDSERGTGKGEAQTDKLSVLAREDKSPLAPRARARVGGRDLGKKSPREVQTEAFYHVALERRRDC